MANVTQQQVILPLAEFRRLMAASQENSKLKERISTLQNELKHALAFTRVRSRIEFWEGMLAPNLLLTKSDNMILGNSTSHTEGEKNLKTDLKSDRRKKKEAANSALKKVPTEVFERISQHSKTWYWILTENSGDRTVQQLLKNLADGEPKVDVVDFCKRMAGFYTITSGASHIVPKQYRKIESGEINDIIDVLGLGEQITIKCLKALLKLG